tara:strand:+ start:6502 stop:6777 length:276 start_codon:yes stop_codon:yes gene_type:complete
MSKEKVLEIFIKKIEKSSSIRYKLNVDGFILSKILYYIMLNNEPFRYAILEAVNLFDKSNLDDIDVIIEELLEDNDIFLPKDEDNTLPPPR